MSAEYVANMMDMMRLNSNVQTQSSHIIKLSYHVVVQKFWAFFSWKLVFRCNRAVWYNIILKIFIIFQNIS